MTLALHIPATPAADWSRLIALSEAAPLLQIDRGHMGRLCGQKLAQQGLAFFLSPPEGGPQRWYLSRSYDPRLLPGKAGEDWQEPDLGGYTQRQQTTALNKRACVHAFRDAKRDWPGTVKEWMPRLIAQLRERFGRSDALDNRKCGGLHISKSSLYQWDQLYRRPADLVKLIDNRGGDHREGADEAAWSMFRDFFLHQNRLSIRQCWQLVSEAAKESGWRWCSLDSCRRQLDTRIPPEIQLKHREPRKWRQTMRPYIAQDPESWAAGECWVGDHKQLDLICRFGDALIRPWLTSWRDWRTRRVCGWVLSSSPNSTTILGALRHGLKDERNFGGPRAVWIDNGKDYDAWVFHGQTKQQRKEKLAGVAVDEPRAFGIFNALQIEPHFSIPFNPNGKSRQERSFRTLERFCKLFSTYTGDAPHTKPEQLNSILATQAHRVPAFEVVYSRLASFIDGSNADADHSIDDLIEPESGERLSPDAAMARWCQTRQVMRDEKALDLLMVQWHKPVTVGRGGVTISIRGQSLHYGQFESALTPFKAASKDRRRPVLIAYDPHDLRSVRVHDEQFRYVCTAQLNQMGGMHGGDAISTEHVAQLSKSKAQYEKSLKHKAEHELTSWLTTEEQLADMAARKPKAIVKEEPPAMRIRQTPIDGQAAAIERDQLRTAVGAESQSAPRRPSVFDRLRDSTPARADAPRERLNALDKMTLHRLSQEASDV